MASVAHPAPGSPRRPHGADARGRPLAVRRARLRAVTMDEVAAEVGVTKPLLYNYFGNKERLYIACMERAGDALTATIARRGRRRPSTPGDALRAGLPRLLRLPRLRPRRLGRALRRDAAARRRDRRAGRRLPRPDRSTWSPTLDARADPAAACSAPPRSRSRPSPGPARRRRGARPLVAAHRGALRRGGGRAADRDDRARPAAACAPVAKTTPTNEPKGSRVDRQPQPSRRHRRQPDPLRALRQRLLPRAPTRTC